LLKGGNFRRYNNNSNNCSKTINQHCHPTKQTALRKKCQHQ
jgi:hypothetical protein